MSAPVDSTAALSTWLISHWPAAAAAGTRVSAVERIDTGANVMSDVYRLTLEPGTTGTAAGAALPRTVILKRDARDEGVRAIAARFGSYRLEAYFYAELAAAAPVRIPRCFVNRFNAQAGELTLVLEDLSALRSPDADAPVGAPELITGMAALGRLHGHFAAAVPAAVPSVESAFVTTATDFAELLETAMRHAGVSPPGPIARSLARFTANVRPPLTLRCRSRRWCTPTSATRMCSSMASTPSP